VIDTGDWNEGSRKRLPEFPDESNGEQISNIAKKRCKTVRWRAGSKE
jgi:hypothetical protein